MERNIIIINTICILVSIYYVNGGPLESRLTLADEWNSYYHADPNVAGSYSFGYDLEDPKSGNVQYRVEEKYPNGTVVGSYGLLEPDGNVKVVNYVADEAGYRVTVEDSNQKYPRFHPPLTSRVEGQRDLEKKIKSPELSFSPAGQSIQEIRTPPKYQDEWEPGLIAGNDVWPGYFSDTNY